MYSAETPNRFDIAQGRLLNVQRPIQHQESSIQHPSLRAAIGRRGERHLHAGDGHAAL
jgi:hypothetical protein